MWSRSIGGLSAMPDPTWAQAKANGAFIGRCVATFQGHITSRLACYFVAFSNKLLTSTAMEHTAEPESHFRQGRKVPRVNRLREAFVVG